MADATPITSKSIKDVPVASAYEPERTTDAPPPSYSERTEADAAQPVDRWAAPSVSSPLAHWPRSGFAQQFDALKPGFNASFVGDRRRPEQPKVEPVASGREEVVKPTLAFSAECPVPLQADVKQLFDKVMEESIGFGLGDKTSKTFQIKYIDRRQWSAFLADRDNELAKQFPSSGVRSLWTRLTRWMARLAHTWTTPIHFDKDSAGDIYIIGENFRRQSAPDKHKRLAEVLVRCLQRATYPVFFATQQNAGKQLHAEPHADMRAYLAGEALSETNVQLCLLALERNQQVQLTKKRWLPQKIAFWRRRPSPESQAIIKRLREEEDIDLWFRRMFDKQFFLARFLFQKGGYVEVSKNLSKEDEAFINKLREINPYGPPRLKR